nr:MAG TPA: hypothetical protein [Bacteriophage sp.]
MNITITNKTSNILYDKVYFCYFKPIFRWAMSRQGVEPC